MLLFERGDLLCSVNMSAEPFALPDGELLLASDPAVGLELPNDTAAWLRRGAA